MQFHGERHSSYFRRSLQAVSAAGGEGPARARLATLATAPLTGTALAALAADVAVPGDTGATLRRVRTWLMLTLIERDLAGAASLDEVCTTMTGFAEWATGRALHGAAQELAARHGRPLDAHGRTQDLLAIGMGKGGRQRTQRLVGSGPGVRVSRRRRIRGRRRRRPDRQQRMDASARAPHHRAARRVHRRRVRVSRRHPAAPERRFRSAGGAARHARAVLLRAGARVGAASPGSRGG